MSTKSCFLFEITINDLVTTFPLFEYLCQGSTGLYKYLTLSVRGPILDVRIWLLSEVYRRQILTSKVGPRAERAKR